VHVMSALRGPVISSWETAGSGGGRCAEEPDSPGKKLGWAVKAELGNRVS
jgi:hypothetical protein